MQHKAGYVNIIGRPNVGKSTLMNTLVGEKLSIITSKAQTTRHRILGIVNTDEYQLIFSDTPGMIKDPAYELQEQMNSFIATSLKDADVLLFMTEVGEYKHEMDPAVAKLAKAKAPLYVLINKIDKAEQETVLEAIKTWDERLNPKEIIPMSALKNFNVKKVLALILEDIPEHPPYYPKDQLTDKPERFFVSEIIREKILKNYRQEVPYSTEVVVETFKQEARLLRIHATIYVNRKTQKSILIGKGGEALKKVGTQARISIQDFFQKKVYLELFVKVQVNWRNDPKQLKNFGYK